ETECEAMAAAPIYMPAINSNSVLISTMSTMEEVLKEGMLHSQIVPTWRYQHFRRQTRQARLWRRRWTGAGHRAPRRGCYAHVAPPSPRRLRGALDRPGTSDPRAPSQGSPGASGSAP